MKHIDQKRAHDFEAGDLLVELVEVFPEIIKLELALAPCLVESDNLVDDLDGCKSPALGLADALGVAALLNAEEVDVQHPDSSSSSSSSGCESVFADAAGGGGDRSEGERAEIEAGEGWVGSKEN